MVTLPDLPGKLVALIGRDSHLDAHPQMLLVEYFYLRGNLDIFEVFLMYFYIGRVKNDLPGGATDKKLTELLAGQSIHTGQVMTAGAGDALVRR